MVAMSCVGGQGRYTTTHKANTGKWWMCSGNGIETTEMVAGFNGMFINIKF